MDDLQKVLVARKIREKDSDTVRPIYKENTEQIDRFVHKQPSGKATNE